MLIRYPCKLLEYEIMIHESDIPILFHADDFGMNKIQSQRILDCSSACGGHGALNSLSIMANSHAFDECADMLEPFMDRLHVTLHVNVVEGPCCANPSDIPLLVDDDGIFCLSFAQMLSMSWFSNTAKKEALHRQLVCEVGAQLDKFLARWPQMKDHLRIDSHQHFHLIPTLFHAVLEVIQSRGCTLEFMRIPAEPLTPFVQTPSIWFKIPAINWIKHWLLNYLWRLDKKYFPDYQTKSAVFCGINFSGHMTPDRVFALYPRLLDYAQTHHMELEMLFHPGGFDDPALAMNPRLSGFVAFYTSPLRHEEARSLQKFADTHEEARHYART